MARTPRTIWKCPFVILYDCNEQLPYTFRGLISDDKEGTLPIEVELEKQDLETADYTIKGFEQRVCVERKSGEDLLKTLLNGKTAAERHRRDNFFKELDRMRSFTHSIIVVESDFVPWLREIPKISDANPRAMARTVQAIQQDYRYVQWAWCHDRPCAEKYTFDYLKRFYKRRNKHEAVPECVVCPQAGTAELSESSDLFGA